MYCYKAIVKRIVDGDTIVVDIDLGFKLWIHNEHVRLLGINTPESRGSEKNKGLVCKEFLQNLLPQNTEVILETTLGSGKYGRCLAKIAIPTKNINNLSEYLVDLGYAKVYTGIGSMPKFPLNERYPLK